MSATNAFEAGINALIFQNANYANIGDATGLRGSTGAGSFYISLHTADPGETGTQSTSETAYTGYARQSVSRSAGGFTASASNISNAAAVTFPTCIASPGANITHFGIGTDLSGAGNLLFSGALSAAYTPAVSNAPSFAIGALDVDTD